LNQLTLDQANQIIQGARAAARAANYKPMGIAVLDASGQLVAFGREDGASMFRFDIARGKAWGAVGMGISSRALAERAKDNPNFFITLSATAEGKFLPQPGAVLIKDANGNVLQNGDSVVTIKNLPVKGTAQSIKAGTKVRNIRLVDSDHNIDCKIDGFGAMALKSEFVKKA
jgi:alkylphosphonate utilization operon protein PhnA